MAALYYIYKNLHKNCWSIKYKGKVIDHCKEVLANDCILKVSQKGREKVLKERQKNVHAFVACVEYKKVFKSKLKTEISYNPYIHPFFYQKSNNNKIENADQVLLAKNGKAFI